MESFSNNVQDGALLFLHSWGILKSVNNLAVRFTMEHEQGLTN